MKIEAIIKYNFSYFCTKIYLVGTYWNRLFEAIPVSTHKIYFGAKIVINIFQLLSLSGAVR